MKRKLTKLKGLIGALGIAMLASATMTVSAEEVEAYPTCYEDGTFSQVTTTASRIFANGASLIFSDGKMYEDVAPVGVFDANDRHIFTVPYIEELKDTLINGELLYDGKHDMELDMVYVETGGVDDTVYGDCSFTVERTTLRGVHVNGVRNASVKIQNAAVLRNYIENAAGNVDYTIDSNTGAVQEIYMLSQDAANQNKDGGLVEGNLNLTLKHVNSTNADILAAGTVLGDTKIVINDSAIGYVKAAHITGNATQKGNVYVQAADSVLTNITALSSGYHGSKAKINGDVSIDVKNCELQFGITNYATTTSYGVETHENVVTGKGIVSIEDSALQYVYDATDKTHNGVIGASTKVTVKNSDVGEMVSKTLNISGNVTGHAEAEYLNLQTGACLTGGVIVHKQLSGVATWRPTDSGYGTMMTVEPGAVLKTGTKIKIVPAKKTDTGFVPYRKTEKLKSTMSIFFPERLGAAKYLKLFTCDYNGLQEYVGGNFSSIRVLNYCPTHSWKKAAPSGDSYYIDCAKRDNVAATCTKSGKEAYYCSICEKYQVRTVKALGHRYVKTRVVPPTTSRKGYTEYKCSRCGHTYKTNYKDMLPKSISKLKFSLPASCTYNGKSRMVTVTVKDGTKKLRKDTDYKVSYKNNKNIGTATVTVTGKGKYTGSKKLTFQILPKQNSITSIKSVKKKTISLKWKKDTKATGYLIRCSMDKYFKRDVEKITIRKNSTTSVVLKNLRPGKTHYVKVASYKKINGKTYIGKYSSVKKIKVKK